MKTVEYTGKNFRGVQCYGLPRRGSGGGREPRTPENFRKFAKQFLKKIAKMYYFRLLFKEISKLCVKFLRAWTRNSIAWEIFDENSI